MKIIFLDVDGVLVTGRIIKSYHLETGKPYGTHNGPFDPISMQNLKDLVDETNAYIVISSVRRYGAKDMDSDWTSLLHQLDEYGLSNRIIGCTPRLDIEYNTSKCRGHEIQKWLDENLDVEGFVVIDDERCYMFNVTDKVAKCTFENGFTDDVKIKALTIINS